MSIEGFERGGEVANSKRSPTFFCLIFSENWMNMIKIGPRTPLRPPSAPSLLKQPHLIGYEPSGDSYLIPGLFIMNFEREFLHDISMIPQREYINIKKRRKLLQWLVSVFHAIFHGVLSGPFCYFWLWLQHVRLEDWPKPWPVQFLLQFSITNKRAMAAVYCDFS